ncbi:MAG: glycosyltransferase family 4 protein [bacterium]|nr:glycosyltransferase family 4 protein [bacterium]
MKIQAYACHEGVQESLLREWVHRGHEVYLTEGVTQWSEARAPIAEGVIREWPANPDVIWVGSPQDVGQALKYKWSRFKPGIPLVLTHWWIPSIKRFAGTVYKFAHQVSVCEWGREYLMEHWKMDSAVMYCPVNPDIFTLREEAPDPKRVICVGNHFPSRSIMGWEYLVQIMDKVYQQDPEVHFEFLGVNPEINPTDYPNVSTRSLPQNEMPDYQAQARCVVITTTFNLIPHSLLGAMALGRNIVAFDLPSLHEVIEHGKSGYLIPQYDTDAFARQILDLTSSPVDPEVGRRGRENVLAKCDYRLVASQYEEFFANVVK